MEPVPLEDFFINSIPRTESTGIKHTLHSHIPASSRGSHRVKSECFHFVSNFFQLLPISNSFQLFDTRKLRHSSSWILMRGGLQRLKRVFTDRALK